MFVLKPKFGIFIFLIVLGLVSVGIFLNRALIYDYVRGISYAPSSEMKQIKTRLHLTEKGEFIFNASQPSLENQANFNSHCIKKENTSAVLGCYTEENIYIYHITEPDLNGILELTTAHELLHAVFSRLSDNEKSNLKNDLYTVLSNNPETFSDELLNYPESEQFEELYVRAGTEVKSLPSALEEHFGLIFQNQDQIVDYYDSYNAVFRELSKKLAELEAEISDLSLKIEQKTLEYEANIAILNSEIAEFNACAAKIGCFTSETEFNLQREQLLESQTALSSENSEINTLISEYNEKIDLYNDNVLRGEKLNNAINSTIKPTEISQ